MMIFLLAVGCCVLLIAFLYCFSSVTAPFLIALCFAYALIPMKAVARKYCHIKNSTLASFLITAIFSSFFIFIIYVLVPMLYQQIYTLVQYANSHHTVFIKQLSSALSDITHAFSPQLQVELSNYIDNIATEITGALNILLKGVVQSSFVAVSFISSLVIIPFTIFYFLKDYELIGRTFYSYIPARHKKDIKKLMSSIHKVIVGFFKGQLCVCGILAVYYAIGFFIVNIKIWMSLGIMFGVLIFIPYLGSLVGLSMSIMITLGQFGVDYHLMKLVVVLILGQIFEGFFLTPKLVGDSVGLHPIYIIFVLLIGWKIGGILGVFVSVPCAAILGALIKFALHKYKSSIFYIKE